MNENAMQDKIGINSTETSAPDARWLALIKATIARFSRGNIAAQNRRILTKIEQKREHAQAVKIAQAWQKRARRSTTA